MPESPFSVDRLWQPMQQQLDENTSSELARLDAELGAMGLGRGSSALGAKSGVARKAIEDKNQQLKG